MRRLSVSTHAVPRRCITMQRIGQQNRTGGCNTAALLCRVSASLTFCPPVWSWTRPRESMRVSERDAAVSLPRWCAVFRPEVVRGRSRREAGQSRQPVEVRFRALGRQFSFQLQPAARPLSRDYSVLVRRSVSPVEDVRADNILVTSPPECSAVNCRLHHVVQGQQERAGEQRGGGTGGLLVPRPLHPGPHRAGRSQLLRGLRKLSTSKYYQVQS